MNSLELKIIPPFQVLILGALMWWFHERFDLSDFYLHVHFGWEYFLSRFVLVLALIIVLLAVLEFWKHKTTVSPVNIHKTNSLITTGVFKWSRNPIYFADILILFAWALWLGFLPGIAVIVIFVCYMRRFQIQPEEVLLEETFGKAYRDYCARTRRWI